MAWSAFKGKIPGFLKYVFSADKLPPLHLVSDASDLENFGAVATAIVDERNTGKIPPYSIEGSYLLIRLHQEKPYFDFSKYQELFDVYHTRISKVSTHEFEVFFKKSAQSDHRLLAISFYRDLLRSSGADQKKITGFITTGCIEFGEVHKRTEFYGDILSSMRQFAASAHGPEGRLGYVHNSLIECYSSYGQFARTEGVFSPIEKLTQISQVLETFMPLESASYYRHPEDLSQTLNYLSEKIVEGELVEIKDAFYRLKTFRLREKSLLLLNSYKTLLNLLIRMYRLNTNMKHLVSSCISVAPHLLAPDCFDDELKELLNWCLQLKDPRIKANTLAALGHFDPENPQLTQFVYSKFNRVASEAIVILARKKLDAELMQQILSFLSSANPFFVASGLYIIGVVCEYHFQRNYEYFHSSEDFKILIERAQIFKNHPHSMIRARALATLKLVENLKGAA